MKKIFIGLLISHLTSSLIAQSFEEITGTPFDGVSGGSVAFADIDNDGDQDVLITGENNSYQGIAKLYTNDGSGFFTEVIGTPFQSVGWSSIAFADIDNDNDQDVLITGQYYQGIAKLYTNDGNGFFSEVLDTTFLGVFFSSIAFADIDNDNDQDVLITGRSGDLGSGQPNAILYTNDGTGLYTEVIGTPFYAISLGAIAFTDIDNDSDQDVIITGSFSAKLYTNDGNGSFTEVIGTPFEEVSSSSVAFADIDDDNDQDMLIAGTLYDYSSTSKLYTNNGNGIFTENIGSSFVGVGWPVCSIAFADNDNDGDQDVLITGSGIAKLYTNDGNGNFTEVLDTPFEGVSGSSIAFADIDNDGDQDVLITGSGIAKLYRNLTISTEVIEKSDMLNRVSFFPNPFSKYVTFSIPENQDQITLELFDLQGRKVMSEEIRSGEKVNMSILNQGVYFFNLIIDDKKLTGKLIKG